MIAQEMFHALQITPQGSNKRMSIKTDISKAYDDMMEWAFIRDVREKISFSAFWIEWIYGEFHRSNTSSL